MRRDTDNLIGQSPHFIACLEHVSRVADIHRPVLVVGERGTGKELIAARLHFLSSRWEQPFVKLNCAAINENLLETELFGHESGAFTGASRRHEGRFEKAHGGTLFLDELATAGPQVQEKLLRVIEYGEFERVGGNRTIKVDVRLVAATNVDLPALTQSGKFRADLLDRLAFDVITLPPLRQRPEDINILAEHFALRMTQDLDRTLFSGFTPAATEQLNRYGWPGNIRELKNVIERNVYLTETNQAIAQIQFDPFASPFRPQANNLPRVAENEPAAPAVPSAIEYKLPMDFKQHIQDYEIEILQGALAESQFSQKKTAATLGLTYHQLRGYLKKYQLLEQL